MTKRGDPAPNAAKKISLLEPMPKYLPNGKQKCANDRCQRPVIDKGYKFCGHHNFGQIHMGKIPIDQIRTVGGQMMQEKGSRGIRYDS